MPARRLLQYAFIPTIPANAYSQWNSHYPKPDNPSLPLTFMPLSLKKNACILIFYHRCVLVSLMSFPCLLYMRPTELCINYTQ